MDWGGAEAGDGGRTDSTGGTDPALSVNSREPGASAWRGQKGQRRQKAVFSLLHTVPCDDVEPPRAALHAERNAG